MTRVAIAVALLLAGCGTGTPVPAGDDATAMASAERKAVADTDGAQRDATVADRPAATGTAAASSNR